MEARIKISKVALFECETSFNTDTKKDITTVKLVGDKIFDLQNKNYEQLNRTLEYNLKRKLSSKYSEDLSKVDVKETFTEELFPEVTKSGRKIISVVFNLNSEKKDSILNKLLNAKESFRVECSKFANVYINYKKKMRGVLGIIQFELVSKKQIIKFISIITADFQNTAISTDPEKAIKQLDKVFDENFKTIIIYPFLIGRKKDIFYISENQARVHQKTIYSDPNILISAELDSPDFPQKILEDLYKKNYSLQEILDQMGEDYAKKANVVLNICSKKLKVSLYDFVHCFDLIHEAEGQGLFIHGKDIEVDISGHNLLNAQKIRKLSLKDLSRKLKENAENKTKTN